MGNLGGGDQACVAATTSPEAAHPSKARYQEAEADLVKDRDAVALQ